MLQRQIGWLGVSIAMLFVAAGTAALAAEPRAVVELFTSQGCSSCPKADQLLGELSKDPNVLALSLPIDYWDYLGWKDTLADARHTARQKAYSKVRGDRAVYTPQMVVNGVAQALGSDKRAITDAIDDSHRNKQVLSVPVAVEISKDDLTVNAAAAAAEPLVAQVWLCPVSKSVKVSIGRGENSGHTLTYTNVVRGWIHLGQWVGTTTSFKVKRTDLHAADADAVAVLVQSGTAEKPGAVIGAAYAGLR